MSGAAESIVVRGPNWLGDTVMALPALHALRSARPDARITLAGTWAGLLAGQGVADVLLPYPRRGAERRRFDRALGAEGVDVAVLLPSSFQSALAARRWRARRRVGFDADARTALLTDPVPQPIPREHQVDEYARLLAPLDVTGAEATPSWRREDRPDREREIDALLADAGIAGRAALVGLHLGTAFGPSKLWPADQFARLASLLAGAKLVPVLLGAPGDQTTADAVTAAARRPPASLVGRDRPALLPHLLARLACLVSGDTGVAHLAASLEVPTVTMFGPTDPRLTAPRGPRARAISRPVPCAPCFLPACPIEHACLRGIDADEVLRHVRQAMAA